MVADGQVHVVGLEGVIDAADQSAGVHSVVLADEEVGVIADAEGQMGLDVFQREQAAFVVEVDMAEFRPLCEDLLEILPDLSMNRTAQCREVIEGGLGEDIEVRCDGWTFREAGTGGEDGEIEGVTADCYSDVRG